MLNLIGKYFKIPYVSYRHRYGKLQQFLESLKPISYFSSPINCISISLETVCLAVRQRRSLFDSFTQALQVFVCRLTPIADDEHMYSSEQIRCQTDRPLPSSSASMFFASCKYLERSLGQLAITCGMFNGLVTLFARPQKIFQ